MNRLMAALCVVLSFLAFAWTIGVEQAWSQDSEQDSEMDPAASGPPLRASVSSARSFADAAEGVPGPGVRFQHDSFARELARDFGFRYASFHAGEEDEVNLLEQLHRRLETKWGDTTVYGWVERCIALYAQFEAMTSGDHAGFDMGLEVDDLSRGRVGLQMSRVIE